MLASTNLFPALRDPLFSVDSASGACPDLIGALRSPLHHSTPPLPRLTTQLLPSFSTPGKHAPHTNARNSFPFYALLHTSRHTPGRGSLSFSPRPEAHPAPALDWSATTHTKALTTRLSPLDATLTKNQGGHHCLPMPTRCSRFITRYTLPQSIRYTIPLRHT